MSLHNGISTQTFNRLSRVCSERSSDILVCKSCTALERVVASRFCRPLSITTSSGGRGGRSRGRVVEESGEEGVKSPNDPKAPNSEDADVEILN